jgi:DNA-directed RNA polymerase specialized sigma24 family protein
MDDWPDFRSVNWSDLYPRLLLYAVGRLRRLLSSRVRPQCQDFVQRAIEKALSGERSYDRGKTLFQNLCQIISSDISHEVQSYENKHTVPDGDTVVNLVDYKQNPEETTHYGEFVRDFIYYLESRDDLAKQIADLMINSDITKSAELALTLGASVQTIENTKKRLRRLTEHYLQSCKEQQKA